MRSRDWMAGYSELRRDVVRLGTRSFKNHGSVTIASKMAFSGYSLLTSTASTGRLLDAPGGDGLALGPEDPGGSAEGVE